ncbi:MAG: hypothetical protein DI535_06025 [Citrobacter freundii]|nr:MAG: hypothetical protein DI535_06025 [Citrobacter freundii]
MATQRTISIIGALEEVAENAIRELSERNFNLLLFYKESDESKRPQSSYATHAANIEWISCPREASWEADAVILAIPVGEQQEIASDIRPVTTGKPVIDIRNGDNNRHALQQLLPDSIVYCVDAKCAGELLIDFFKQ